MKLLDLLEALYALPVFLFLAGLSLLVYVIDKDNKADSWGNSGSPLFVNLVSFGCLLSGLFSMLLLLSFSLCAAVMLVLLYDENTKEALIYGALGGFTSLLEVWAGAMLFSTGRRILHKEKALYAAKETSRLLQLVGVICGASLYFLRWYLTSHKAPYRYFEEVFLLCVLLPCTVAGLLFVAHSFALWGVTRRVQGVENR
jgi:hypothetical protein